ncbi:MAG: hypothetical protein JNL66_04705, partial [Alphaproteobacteria bacterium]|nr:hypothetical protein [Alphaproteobacteria bacterium]
MIIGLDFDNTIIAYDDVFRAAACARELIRSDDGLRRKREIRDAIRRSPDGERKWQDLQGFVYGRGIVDARLFDGVEDFLRRCRDGGHRVLIISHKTRYGHFDPTGTDLREAALDWMEARGFFERGALGITRGDVSFHDTRADKLRGIAKLGCTHFIDDLEEVLSDPSFPRDVERILFGECSATPSCRGYPSYPTWSEISAAFFSTAAVPSFAGRESGAPEPDRTLSTDVARRLVGGPIDSIEPAGQGRNSRVYRVVSAGRPFALKHYLRTHRDKRDRLGTEVDALEMLQRGA